MDEILELQKLLMTVQLQDAAHRLSERNCLAMIQKLLDQKKIDVIFTKSGKEYLTQKQLRREIEQEIKSHGGRIDVLSLEGLMNVHGNYIDEQVSLLMKSAGSKLVLLNGQLITSYYIDGIMEEVNDMLQDAGVVFISDLAYQFSLPFDFIRQALEQRMSTIVQGVLKSDQLYTTSYVESHHARVRGAFAAVMAPTPVSEISAKHKFEGNCMCLL